MALVFSEADPDPPMVEIPPALRAPHKRHNLSSCVFGKHVDIRLRMMAGAILMVLGVELMKLHFGAGHLWEVLCEAMGGLIHGAGITPYLDKFIEWAGE